MRLRAFRVVSFISSDEVFGHEKGMTESLLALQASGAKLSVGVRRAPSNIAEYVESRGLSTFPVSFGPQLSLKWLMDDPTFALKALRRIFTSSRQGASHARNFKATHVHIGSLQAYAYLYPWLRRTNLPIIYRAGDAPPTKSRFQMTVWKSAMRRASAAVCNSQFVRFASQNEIERNYDLVYNYVADVGIPKADSSSSSARVLYVGSMSEHKGVEVLLRGFALTLSHHPEARLDLVGGSQYTKAYERHLYQCATDLNINHAVEFHGYLSDYTHLLAQACVTVVPSLWDEPAANTVLEAKQAGIPTIVFPSGGLVELVSHSIDGIICEAKSPSHLSSALCQVLSNEDALKAMGGRARRSYETQFGFERFVDQWAQIYSRVSQTVPTTKAGQNS